MLAIRLKCTIKKKTPDIRYNIQALVDQAISDQFEIKLSERFSAPDNETVTS